MTAANAIWRVRVGVSGADAANAVFSMLDGIADVVSAFETAPEEWSVEAYPQSPQNLTAEFEARLTLAAVGAGGEIVAVSKEKLPARDWLAENELAFPPLRVGRFFIYGSHHHSGVPAGTIGIAIDAATAFGTGEHPSTRACLIVLQGLARRRRYRKPLDIGTGSGILSIAAAKLLRRRVLASDIDPGAVEVARHNTARNGVARLVQVRHAPGYRGRMVRRSRGDLILSNILVRPLAELATDLAGALAPSGRAVLSGLLRRQEPIVLARHRSCGLILDHRLEIEGWSTLVLRRRPKAEVTMGAETSIYEFGPVTRPFAGRISRASGRVSARPGRAFERPPRDRQSASGGSRYRTASDHRAPSARHRPAPGAAIRKRFSRPK